MVLSAFPSRAARLSASVEKAFGEMFTFEAFKSTDDPNGRPVPDDSRATFTKKANWFGPGASRTPIGRGAASDDRAHNWTATLPMINMEDAAMLWPIQPGDKITRMVDGAVYAAGAPYPDGFGRTSIPLTSRKR